MPKPTRVFSSLCIPSRGAWERLWEADSSPLPQRVPTSSCITLPAVWSCLCQWHQASSLPRGARRAGASQQTRSEPASCGKRCGSPSRHHCPASGGLPAILQSSRSCKHPREKRKLEKAVGFELSRRLPALRANGKAGFAFRRHSLPTGSSQMCAGVWGWQLHGGGLFWFCRKEMVSPPRLTLPCSLMRLQGGMHRGTDTGWAASPRAYATPFLPLWD